MFNSKMFASLCLVGALLLTDGAYGADWPDWLRGILLGVLGGLTVSFTAAASRTQRAARPKVRERSE